MRDTTTRQRVLERWQLPAGIGMIAVLAAVAVPLLARDQAGLRAEREARAAVADAVAPVSDEIRTELDAAVSGTAPGSTQVSFADSTSAGVASDIAIEARDTGEPVLADSGAGVVVVATYDTPSVPATVAERRERVTGLRVVPLALEPTLTALKPSRGGISLAGPERTVQSFPDRQPEDGSTYAVKLAPGPAPEWTLTLWAAPSGVPAAAWLSALGLVALGLVAAAWLRRRDERSRRNREELVRLQRASARTAALATVAQHSLDLADLLPALTTELATSLGLTGLSLGAPTADGERQLFAWGSTPGAVAGMSVLPAEVSAGETLCLILGRGGRTVARLRVVAGRTLDAHDLSALGAATEVLTSALVNAETFAQQRDLLERMRSVDELKTVFLATASHELRTPVGAITGYAQLLASSWDSLSPEEARTFAEQVDSNAQRLGALVEDLLDFSRLERGAGVVAAASTLDLGQVVAQILEEHPHLSRDHEVRHQAGTGLCVAGSPQSVERVVMNLVGNAAKYSPAGTVIRVSVTEQRGRAELAVADEGPGVPESEREQIFTRFFRGRGDSVVATQGAGLGLAIVTEFAASMGGRVSVASSDNGGARFVVSYPLAESSQARLEGAVDVAT